jgi:hypothetical protein
MFLIVNELEERRNGKKETIYVYFCTIYSYDTSKLEFVKITKVF